MPNNIENLMSFTSSGDLTIASFTEIKEVLINEFKRIYGTDIDISTASADGQFVNDIGLIINNILQSTKYIFNNLNPNSASDKFLDILCSYNNIQRIGNSPSTCQLVVKNISGTDLTPETIQFVDNVGNYWTWTNPRGLERKTQITLVNNTNTVLTNVTCDTLGKITNVNSMEPIEYGKYQVITDDQSVQIHNLIMGTDRETDAELIARRTQYLGNQSVSILSGVRGTLLNLYGIEDVWIYNNYGNESLTISAAQGGDGISIPAHSIYLCIRYAEGLEDNDTVSTNIGTIIYNKLTPGVGTAQATGVTGGTSKSFYIEKYQNLGYTIYWKKCTPITPKITITFKYSNEYPVITDSTGHVPTSDLEKNIAQSAMNYLNNVKIGNAMEINSLQNAINQNNYLDSSNASIFYITSGGIGTTNASTNLAPLTYYNYVESNFNFKYDTTKNEGTLIIG